MGVMQTQFEIESPEQSETQLGVIRELMLQAARREGWLTLGEIAGRTGFGEASISAQLRHLRKAVHGRYRVEKRRRSSHDAGEEHVDGLGCVWEYRVLPPG